MVKRTYVVQSENGGFWCGLNSWDVQLRKAQIFHSLKYARDVVRRFNQYNCKIVEVSLTIVPEAKTNADRIRAMSDEELARLIDAFTQYFGVCNKDNSGAACIGCELYHLCSLSEGEAMEWLKQPAEDTK